MAKQINMGLQRGPTLRKRVTRDFDEQVIEFNGTWASVNSAMPDYDARIAGFGNYRVVDADAQRASGAGGKLVVTMRKPQLLPERLSVRWVRSQRPITDSKYFSAGSSSDAKMSQIECWKREKDHALRAAFKFRAPVLYGTTVVVWEEFEIKDAKTLKLAKKILAGQTGYWWWYPVVRRMRTFDEPPEHELTYPTIYTAAELLDRVGAPRVIKKIDGAEKTYKKKIPLKGREKDTSGTMTEFDYQYLLTDYDIEESDNDLWTVTEAWMGAQEFDEDYYGS